MLGVLDAIADLFSGTKRYKEERERAEAAQVQWAQMWEQSHEQLRAEGFRPFVTFVGMDTDVFRHDEVMCASMDGCQIRPNRWIVRPREMHPAMNIANVFWKPVAEFDKSPASQSFKQIEGEAHRPAGR